MYKKHAYLIMAHHEPQLLQTLISLIDDVRNDIFVALDSKSDREQFRGIKATKSSLVFTKPCDVRWGSIKQVEAEYLLFETAYAYGAYAYYHLLSGVCLPLKSQDVIHATCDSMQGVEFVGFVPDDEKNRQEIEKKTSYYYVFQNHFRASNFVERFFIKPLQKTIMALQMYLGVNMSNKFNQWGGKKRLQLGKHNVRFLSLFG